jgi:hypothetical protein
MNSAGRWWLALGGSAAIAAVVGAGVVMAQSPTPNTGASPTAVPGKSNSGTFKSNEDPTHEKGETAQQEAAEDSGQGFHGGFRSGKSNEDPTHEKGESAAREAAEDAGQTPNAAPSPSAN